MLFLSKKRTHIRDFLENVGQHSSKPVPKPLKVPSLARSVLKPLKVPSLARSVPKPLKVSSLARSVPKPLCLVLHVLCQSLERGAGGGGRQAALCFAPRASFNLRCRPPTPLVVGSEVRGYDSRKSIRGRNPSVRAFSQKF